MEKQFEKDQVLYVTSNINEIFDFINTIPDLNFRKEVLEALTRTQEEEKTDDQVVLGLKAKDEEHYVILLSVSEDFKEDLKQFKLPLFNFEEGGAIILFSAYSRIPLTYLLNKLFSETFKDEKEREVMINNLFKDDFLDDGSEKV